MSLSRIYSGATRRPYRRYRTASARRFSRRIAQTPNPYQKRRQTVTFPSDFSPLPEKSDGQIANEPPQKLKERVYPLRRGLTQRRKKVPPNAKQGRHKLRQRLKKMPQPPQRKMRHGSRPCPTVVPPPLPLTLTKKVSSRKVTLPILRAAWYATPNIALCPTNGLPPQNRSNQN